MLEIFTPYMLFISFLLTVLFNIWLISKNIHWIVILIANLLLVLVMEFFNLAEYNFLNKIIDWFFDLIAKLIGKLLDLIFDIYGGIWDSTIGALIEKIKEWLGISSGGSTGGGGGGFGSR